jgi:hypothetical protein
MLTRCVALTAAVGLLAVWAAAQAPPTGVLAFELKGLTDENAGEIETTLTGLERNAFRCKTCDYFAQEEGDCPGCETALVPDKSVGPLLRDVKVDVAKHVVTFGVAPANIVRLGEIDAALAATGAEIDRTKLAVLPFTRITINEVTAEGAGKVIETALTKSKLFDNAKVEVNTDHKQATVIVGNAKPAPTLEAVTQAIEKAGPFKVAYITWIAPCPRCAEKGMKHAGCASCWEKRT